MLKMTSQFNLASEHCILYRDEPVAFFVAAGCVLFCSKKPQLLGWEHGSKIRGPKFDTVTVKLDGFGRKFFQTVVDVPRFQGSQTPFPRNFCLRDISI